MAGIEDMLARSQAAGGMMGGLDAGMAPPPTEEPMPPETPESEQPDVEQGLGIVEAFAESVDPQTGDQIREHVNAIRELTAEAAPMPEGPTPEETAATGAEPPPPIDDEGLMP